MNLAALNRRSTNEKINSAFKVRANKGYGLVYAMPQPFSILAYELHYGKVYVFMGVIEHYGAVLQDLEVKREPLLRQIEDLKKGVAELDSLIEGIKKAMNGLPVNLQTSFTVLSKSPPEQSSEMYKNISMRWAILQLLTKTPLSLPTANIASELLIGGFPPSPNFNSKVSAILSQMTAKNEVTKEGQDWKISTHGADMWESITHSDKYRYRNAENSSVDID